VELCSRVPICTSRCNIHVDIQPILPHQGWKIVHHQCTQGKSKISLVSANPAKKLISFNEKYVLPFFRENHSI